MKEQTNIFSMFGIVDEVEEKRRKEEEERKKRLEDLKSKSLATSNQTKTNIKEKEEKSDDFSINENTVVYHLGEYIPITDYFEAHEINNGIEHIKNGIKEFKKLDGNEVRKRFEKDFPDLVAAYTEMVYIKKKNMIIAVAKAKKKGLNSSSIKEDSPLSQHKIPYSILADFIALSHKVYKEKRSECHADIYFDLDTQRFFMDIPEQLATYTWVEVTESAYSIAERLCEIRFIKVMEIHSHHVMSPIPSSQDNDSERDERFLYAIVGDIHNVFPSIVVRYFRNGIYHYVEPSKIFSEPFLRTEYNTSLIKIGEVV